MGGAYAFNNFADPITFLCGAIQAASRLGAEQSAKLCVQYLAPIVKNRQYNFPPLGENLVVGATARPNEVTYSEDWMRPDYVPPRLSAPADLAVVACRSRCRPRCSPPIPTRGLRGIMVPGGDGSLMHALDGRGARAAAVDCSAVLPRRAVGGAASTRCLFRAPRAAAAARTRSRRSCPKCAPSSPTRACRSTTSRWAPSTKIERQGWHALLTMRIEGDVELPANATATVGQSGLLGSLHVELAPPDRRRTARAS